MKRLHLILLVFSLTILTSFAQVDTKAKGILDGLSAKIKTYTSMQIDFTQSMVNTKDKINTSQSGKAILKGDKYNLTLKSQTVICDGKTVWTYLKDANEVNIDNVSTDEDAVSPAKIFKIWEKGFKYKFIKEEVQAGVNVQIIDLTPIKGKSYFKVRLTIDKAKQQLLSSSIYEKNGTTFTYKITKFVPNIATTDAQFTFNKANYPKVQVNDMR